MCCDIKKILLAILMLLTAFGAYYLQPKLTNNAIREDFELNSRIPSNFGNWTLDDKSLALVVNEDVKSELENIYSQTFFKSYINKITGYNVMLSIAYGREQSQSLQIHRPEVCYASQGFTITDKNKIYLDVLGSQIPAMQMFAVQGIREEPITYWVRIGDKLVRGNIEQGLARLEYGLTGKIPDGILFRVSSIDGNLKNAFAIQNEFINALVSSLGNSERNLLLGSFGTIENTNKK